MFTADTTQTIPVQSPAQQAVPGRTAARVMPAETDSVPALRRFARGVVRGVVREWELPEGVDEAVALIVTELASNAVLHSGSPDVAVRITRSRRVVTVEVKDRGRWRSAPAERPQEPFADACSGRGLGLVRAYASGCLLWHGPFGTRAVAKVPLAAERR